MQECCNRIAQTSGCGYRAEHKETNTTLISFIFECNNSPALQYNCNDTMQYWLSIVIVALTIEDSYTWAPSGSHQAGMGGKRETAGQGLTSHSGGPFTPSLPAPQHPWLLAYRTRHEHRTDCQSYRAGYCWPSWRISN